MRHRGGPCNDRGVKSAPGPPGSLAVLFDYDDVAVAVRDDLTGAHAAVWDALAAPGTWLDAAERTAVAGATRDAAGCALCAARRQALSPNAVDGDHDGAGGVLDATTLDVVHRMATDPARLTEAWYREVGEGELGPERYVEVVALVAQVVAVDRFCLGVGAPERPLDRSPGVGSPTRRAVTGATSETAWVPTVQPHDAMGEVAELYGDGGDGAPNIRKALSLVPRDAARFFDLTDTMYVPPEGLLDVTWERSISRPQMELLAARVSAVNECFY